MPIRETVSEEELFEFDAPRIKDFTKKEYQHQKVRIEKLLKEHGNPGVPQDPSKAQLEKKIKVPAPAPRKTFFSEMFRGSAQKAAPEPFARPSPESEFFEGAEISNQSVDDGWFQKKELEIEEFQNMSVNTIAPSKTSQNILSRDLFLSDDEAEILPHLKVIATPPIKRMKVEIHSPEFGPHDIQELSKSLSFLQEKRDGA
ncbi:uncharacterized protein NEMAJ01_2056 [Nematocida major]|uniref:uncharacterized protein n=1 Tax=Nematocida major TaxID=1912982 RepID=UPI002007F85D|nr:uncharacterized protein NEMAJ01_2056 [Nematocida major]KAH9387160.1 hypothetical protein NEMAJ01_2056 [Nematocida major]